MIVYVAGPMSGNPDFNSQSFHSAADRLRSEGHTVINPAENFGGDKSLAYGTYLRLAIPQVAICNAIALLPGYATSMGARAEIAFAIALGHLFIDAETGMAIPTPILAVLPTP